jgi:hypothetical protein
MQQLEELLRQKKVARRSCLPLLFGKHIALVSIVLISYSADVVSRPVSGAAQSYAAVPRGIKAIGGTFLLTI